MANYLESNIVRYMSSFMDILLNILGSNDFSFDTKIATIITLGDIFLVTGESYEPYLEKTMTSLRKAGELSMNTVGKDQEYIT